MGLAARTEEDDRASRGWAAACRLYTHPDSGKILGIGKMGAERKPPMLPVGLKPVSDSLLAG